MDERNEMTILKFAGLAILTLIPLGLFVFGIVSKQTAFFIFLPIAVVIILYCLFPLFRKKKKIESNSNQMTEVRYPDISEFDTIESELETVKWSKEKR